MNGDNQKIEVLAPFSKAFELMKQILFRPFEIEKWLIIGFAAFLARLGGGGSANPNFLSSFNRRWNTRSDYWQGGYPDWSEQMHGWFWPAMIVGIPLLLGLIVVFLWVGSRGRFIFTDCIVRNRAAMVEPWREYRREGNSLFLFSLLVALAMLAVIGAGFIPFILPSLRHHGRPEMTLTLALIFWIVLVAVFFVAWALVSRLMVPIMYRQRCRAWEAFQRAIELISANAVSFIIYILFVIVVSVAIFLFLFAVACLTCCVAGCLFSIPYVGSVVTLPIEIVMTGYTLLFLRQFGPDFDVWAGGTSLPSTDVTSSPVAPVESPESPSVPPILSEPSPPPQVLPPEPPPRSPYEPPGAPPPDSP